LRGKKRKALQNENFKLQIAEFKKTAVSNLQFAICILKSAILFLAIWIPGA